MKVLNVDFNENIIWSYESALPILKRANPTKTEKELKSLLKASKIVKDELPKNTSKGSKRKGNDSASVGNVDNIQ